MMDLEAAIWRRKMGIIDYVIQQSRTHDTFDPTVVNQLNLEKEWNAWCWLILWGFDGHKLTWKKNPMASVIFDWTRALVRQSGQAVSQSNKVSSIIVEGFEDLFGLGLGLVLPLFKVNQGRQWEKQQVAKQAVRRWVLLYFSFILDVRGFNERKVGSGVSSSSSCHKKCSF